LQARLTTFLCKKIIDVKSKVEARWSKSQEWTNLVKSFKEGYGSKRVVSPMMMMMMTTYKHTKTGMRFSIPVILKSSVAVKRSLSTH
jgi:hypothetical protein